MYMLINIICANFVDKISRTNILTKAKKGLRYQLPLYSELIQIHNEERIHTKLLTKKQQLCSISISILKIQNQFYTRTSIAWYLSSTSSQSKWIHSSGGLFSPNQRGGSKPDPPVTEKAIETMMSTSNQQQKVSKCFTRMLDKNRKTKTRHRYREDCSGRDATPSIQSPSQLHTSCKQSSSTHCKLEHNDNFLATTERFPLLYINNTTESWMWGSSLQKC